MQCYSRVRFVGSEIDANEAGGVDLSLIEEMLRLSPYERLVLNDQLIDTILELRESFRGLRDGEQ